ncbi:5-formyltetrahydrofolate cyclo-ligase [Burkholderia cenocepacia]|uniref:5-formyltetrahydrofolate cyclo-ligase n=1 Tax=Burkholderia cenocepacia TaxID=95486 RepID=UPI00222F7615|nr:5-formyltetrahydrofolate cyclo-ligase [Burkholderia cenocepacia]MCW5151983.1 5-formyltetrahydrofolate cyclo-ligase [Burkholderia cenocepacia]MCW5159941.1 5-formyltetrahydrofolate cyclo-ligase [Burkholderia cenocepacia]MCW5167863.1 5-formyltetrahydrofolate cyclo-ligase [Burkholderia cenocepacia]
MRFGRITNNTITPSMKRRTFLALPAVAASGMLAGCSSADLGPVTHRLMKDPEYRETLSAFLISADGKKLVVIGKQYHYIFDVPPALAVNLTAPYRPKLYTDFDDFETHGDTISGRYVLRLAREDAPPGSELRERALADGFKDQRHQLTESGTISGKRYQPNDVTPSSVPQAFNHEYDVKVIERPSVLGKGAKLALSPITMAADGALGLLGLALFPIALTAFIVIAS